MIDCLESFCRTCLAQLSGCQTSGALRFVLVKRRRTNLVFAFVGREQTPRLLVKVAKQKSYNAMIEAEGRNTQRAWAALSNPDVLFEFGGSACLGGHSAVAYRFENGANTFPDKPPPEAFLNAFLHVAPVLCKLQGLRAPSCSPWRPAFWHSLMGQIDNETWIRQCGKAIGEKDAAELAARAFRCIDSGPGAAALVHGDAGFNNIYTASSGRMLLADWEHSLGIGPALYDRVYFIVHWNFYVGIPRNVFDSTDFRAVIRKDLCAVGVGLGLPLSAASDWVAACTVSVISSVISGKWTCWSENDSVSEQHVWLRQFVQKAEVLGKRLAEVLA